MRIGARLWSRPAAQRILRRPTPAAFGLHSGPEMLKKRRWHTSRKIQLRKREESRGRRGVPRARHGAELEYVEFELDAETLRQVEELAREADCTAFEMCVTLLRERLAASGGRELRG
jgi:hypothetical protein